MNDIVLNRLKDICPSDNVDDLTLSELTASCRIAFEIIGYEPENLDDSVRETYESRDIQDLSDFIFEVWRVDK